MTWRRRLLTVAIVSTTAQMAATFLFRRERRQFAGDRRHILVTQGGLQLRPAGDEIAEAVVSVMMGGVILDLRDTELPRRPAHVEILAIMGGVQLVVPATWNVRVEVEPTMAGVRDQRIGSVDPERPTDIVVSGRVVMGGLDISSELPGIADSRQAT